jgi:hypothetical protein
VGVAAAGGFEPSQAIKTVTPKARQMIGTIFMEMGVLTKSFGIKMTSLRVYLTIPSGSSPIPTKVSLSAQNPEAGLFRNRL